MQTVSQHYINGISDAREEYEAYGMEDAADRLANIESTLKRFAGADSEMGQYLRGERDFWRNQIKKAKINA